MALHNSLRRRSIIACTVALKVRTVPTSVALPGMTLMAFRSPACIAHKLITALSTGLTLRDTMLCTAVMMWPATSTGSIVW